MHDLLDPERHNDNSPDKTWCKIGQAYCADDCTYCTPWLATCEECYDYGHQCGSWILVVTDGNALTYCENCADKLGIEGD